MSGSSTVLLNDLDITLSDSINTYYPDVSNSNSHYDRLNPVEIIRLSTPSRNTTYTVTVSAHILVKTQPYAIVISGNLGKYPYTPPERDYTMYILAGLLMMGLLTSCVLCCVYSMMKKKKDSAKIGSRMDDDDEESTQREDYTDLRNQPKHQIKVPVKQNKTTKKIHPENS